MAVWMTFENLLGWIIVIYYDASRPDVTFTDGNTTNTANNMVGTTNTANTAAKYTTANVGEWFFWVWGVAPTVASLIVLGILSLLTTNPMSSAKVWPAGDEVPKRKDCRSIGCTPNITYDVCPSPNSHFMIMRTECWP